MTKKKKNKQKLEEELIEEADEEIEEIEEDRIIRLENQLKRVIADYKNLEKRTEEKRAEWALTSSSALVKKLLPVLDDLFLAQKHIQDDGLSLLIQKFLDTLKEEGVEMVETKDSQFDPNTMECVSVQEGEKNMVLEEVKKGYTMNGNVLRPAQVVVGGQQASS